MKVVYPCILRWKRTSTDSHWTYGYNTGGILYETEEQAIADWGERFYRLEKERPILVEDNVPSEES